MTGVMSPQIGTFESVDVFERASDRESERMVGVEQLPRHVVDIDLVSFLIELFQDLLTDDLLFGAQFGQ